MYVLLCFYHPLLASLCGEKSVVCQAKGRRRPRPAAATAARRESKRAGNGPRTAQSGAQGIPPACHKQSLRSWLRCHLILVATCPTYAVRALAVLAIPASVSLLLSRSNMVRLPFVSAPLAALKCYTCIEVASARYSLYSTIPNPHPSSSHRTSSRTDAASTTA